MNTRSIFNFPARFIAPALASAVFLAGGGVGSTLAQAAPPDNPKLLARAKVSRQKAREIALTQAPAGTIVQSVELEEEAGSLRWSFDLKTPGSRHVTEIGVDARTGKVIEKRVESTREEAREKREEARETRRGKTK